MFTYCIVWMFVCAIFLLNSSQRWLMTKDSIMFSATNHSSCVVLCLKCGGYSCTAVRQPAGWSGSHHHHCGVRKAQVRHSSTCTVLFPMVQSDQTTVLLCFPHRYHRGAAPPATPEGYWSLSTMSPSEGSGPGSISSPTHTSDP